MTDEQIIELMARTFIDALDHDDFYVDAEGFAANHAVIDGSGDIGKPMRAALTALRSAGMAVVPRQLLDGVLNDARSDSYTVENEYCRGDDSEYLGHRAKIDQLQAMIKTAEGKTE